MKWAIALVALVALARWLTFDVQPVPEIAAIRVERRVLPGTLCENQPIYLPTLVDPAEVERLVDAGEAYCVEPRYGDGSALSVTLRSDDGITTLGSKVHAPVVMRVRWTQPPPPGQEIVLYRDQAEVKRGGPSELELRLDTPGTYHIELSRLVPTWYFGQKRVVWIITYPFTVLDPLA